MFLHELKKIVMIEGMSCSHCAKKVEESLKNIENVKKVKVDLKNKTATIIYKKELSELLIKNKIEELGYRVIKFEEEI